MELFESCLIVDAESWEQAAENPCSRLQMHLQELQEYIPVGRKSPVSAGMHVVAERVQNGLPRRRHLVGVQSLFPEQLVNRSRRHRSQEFAFRV